ncbi:integrase [Mycobacteroides chelonae]|uniref:tyrosine-type recombinase/integrase n=1 Tax=Mycobacteroides TaxID=670516 RepID=UPI000713F737|nr:MULTISPECIES: site-specific integrase [Mycobacteroides]KRQ17906.1 integrase [Mycobacteroides sp. H072]KRQ29802.1 integrase [Mycobacteroides sp. H002]KRQ44851.1 integrase [Mycobacteroides sp. H054]KRQ68937.1 integrase [Mycobacteroides sp. H001]MBF9351908.1 site-specific integrase [Mycobacteroides chelonae]
MKSAQLELPLPWGPAMAENSVATSVDLVVSDWALDGAMSTQTLDKFTLLARRFIGFAAAHDVTTLDAVDHGLVAKFVAAKGRSRHGEVAPAAVATMHNRRAALRAYFRTARRLGLVLHDPTTDIDVPDREASALRSLTDDEAVLVRLFSEHATPTRHAATTALLLAGAHTSELGHIRISDIDTDASTVWVHGSTKHRARTLALDTWARRVVDQRIAYLTAHGAAGEAILCTGADGSDAQRQARVCVTVRDVLTRAGLTGTAGIKPSSLTAYAARRVFEDTGRIESAAKLIGSGSLDSTAALIGYQWHQDD